MVAIMSFHITQADTDAVGWGNGLPCSVLDRILLAVDVDGGRLNVLDLHATALGTIERGNLMILGSAMRRVFSGTTRWDGS